MGTKVRIEQEIDESEDWSDQFESEEDNSRLKLKYNGKRRRQIEDLMEDRRLAQQLRDDYDDWD